MESLLTQILEEQRKTNQLLALLIEALAEEPEEADAQPACYMDGTPVAPPTVEYVGNRRG